MTLKPVDELLVGIAFNRQSSNQFPNKVLAIKSALASALVDSNFPNRLLNFLTRNDFFRSALFRRLEFQYADIVALFPLAVGLFSYVTKFSGGDMRTL